MSMPWRLPLLFFFCYNYALYYFSYMKPKNIEEYLEQAEEYRQSIFRKMTAKEKLDLSFSLYRTAWKLKRAAIKQAHPEWTDEQVENKVKEIFLYAQS